MRSRMTPEQLAKLKGKSADANETRALARKANGHGANSADAGKARRALEQRLGKRGADRAQENAIVAAGGRAKGIRRWFG
jgi:hypothetical protein